ncbi:F-box only protein FBXO9/FBXO48 [Abortiporus biennis]
MEPEEDPEELARFREQWREEVRRRKEILHATKGAESSTVAAGQAEQSPSKQDGTAKEAHKSPAHRPRGISHTIHPSDVPVNPTAHTVSPALANQLSPRIRAAADVYRSAVECEQRSELDEALFLYRKAFRMEPNVDRIYHMLEGQHHGQTNTLKQKRLASPPPLSPPSLSLLDAFQGHPPPPESIGYVVREMGGLDINSTVNNLAVKLPASHGMVTGSLVSIIGTWSGDLMFEREDEKESVPIASVPDEILVHILSFLDVTSLERFSLVSKKARIITLDSSLWRELVVNVYQPPQVEEEEDLEFVIKDFLADYRRLFIEHPRVRLDGVYIAICHYIRNGLSENAWVQISQLITYHRYLRFLPDGQVLSLLANEGLEPQQVISMLKPSLRMKGFLIGNWQLLGTTIQITDLQDPNGKHSRYTFQMTLDLRSRPMLGRWNRLDFKAYESVQVESGEMTPVALKHDRPFWFSKVKSYSMGG